jgi:ABC-type glycerol-3-phosphate transport system substrate-binding protein
MRLIDSGKIAMASSWMKLIIAIAALVSVVPVRSARAEEPILLIRMPDEPALDYQPSEVEIIRFVAAHSAHLHMTPQELLRGDLARHALGQKQIFIELAEFQSQCRMPAKVKFITWADALRYFADYVSDPSNPPVVAQIGDTWAAYFRSLGVMPYEQRHTWDVRMLWYWKDMVNSEEIANADGFMAACRRLREAPPPGLTAPFVIPTALDWNLLHDLSIWLYNAGLPSLISTDKKMGIIPWKEAVFGGPEGERAARFLIELAKRGYVALPERYSAELGEEFLARKYAMVILGPWIAERARKQLGPGWEQSIGAALPPAIGAGAATTIKGGSLVVVLDPSRGKDAGGVARARRLVDFLISKESQRRYTQALGALPANPQALAESPYFPLFKAALERGRAYSQLPEWAPVVENLATRDNLYAFWKRLSALADTHSTVSQGEQEVREKLIFAALHSAESDINRELSPGKVSFLWPWLVVVLLLSVAIAVISVYHQHVERKRIVELRQARDDLATLQRRLASMEGLVGERIMPTPTNIPTLTSKGYPTLYLDAAKRKILLRKAPAQPLEELIHGAEYDLFRHIIESLQMGWSETHWIWGYVIWPSAHPKFPKEAFATHCTRLRKSIEKVWRLGQMLGRGTHQGGIIPIEVRDVHFYTDAETEGSAYPVWALFQTSERAMKAYKAKDWEAVHQCARELLQIDPENWSANMLLCHLVIQNYIDCSDSLAQKAIEFAHRQIANYQMAIEKIEALPEEKVNREQKERIRDRLESLQYFASQLPSARPSATPLAERKPWRTREQLSNWASYLNGEKQALPEEEINTLREVQSFIRRRLHWASSKETLDLFREFVQELALDKSRWPDEKLPCNEKTFRYRALDYIMAGVLHLSDDEGSKAPTKAQNLRKLWNIRAQLRRQLEREPTNDELYEECQQRYSWSRSAFDSLLELEKFCSSSPLNEPN